MNENLKTGIYAGVAVVVLLVALVVWPRTQLLVEEDLIGEQLFADFENPSVARSMSIVIPDASSGNFEDFSVARRNGLWVVPSHGNYPVDSPERLTEAALALVDLEVIDIASESASDHAMFGVLDPDSSGISPAVPGMGTKVVLSDEQGTKLAEIIIGHAVQGSEENRFVRLPGRDAVYVVGVEIEPFASRFQDWINSDLLQVSAQEINGFLVNDYGFTEDGDILPRFMISAAAGPQPPTPPQQQQPPPRPWLVERFYEASAGELQVSELLPGEVLNSASIASLLETVTQLRIVDVVRKPAAMAEQLKVSEYLENADFDQELRRFGFEPFPVSKEDSRVVFFASNGEVVIQTDSGIEYKLSFGRPLSGQEGSSASDLRRYMMVVARLNGDLVPSPELLPLPTPPESPEITEEAAAPTEGETPTEEQAAPPTIDETVLEGPPAGVSEEEWNEYLAKLLQVRQMNKSRLDAHSEQMRAQAERVQDLNNRFADWFYVISEQEYDRMHLSRTELFTAGEGGVGLEEFQHMIEEGLIHSSDTAVPNAPDTAPMQ